MTVRIVHKNSSASGKNPTAAQLANGELSINYNSDGPFLSVKDTAGNIIRVGGVWINGSSPPDPKKGALWVNPNTNTLYIRDDSEWIAIAGGNGGGAGDVTAVTEGPGIDVADSGGPTPKVSIDLHAESGLETTPAGDGGKLRVRAGTLLSIDANGILNCDAGGLTYIGVVSCDDDGDLQDADVGDVYASDVTTVNGTNSVTAAWYTCITNLASPNDVSVGDLLICTTAGGGTPANARYTRLATGGANQITTINANAGLTATVAGGNTVNLKVDLHTSANGNDSGLETDPAGNNGKLRVKAGAGLTIIDAAGDANQGDLVVDAANIPRPGGNDGNGNFGYWTRDDANDRLTPRAANDVVTVAGGTAAAPGITHTGDTDTGIAFAADNQVNVSARGLEGLRVNSAAGGQASVIVNPGNINCDFSVESDTPANDDVLFVDASADRVGIGEGTPEEMLHVNGDARVDGHINLDTPGGDLIFTGTDDGNTERTISFQAPTGVAGFGAPYTVTLPPDVPQANEVLQVTAVAGNPAVATTAWNPVTGLWARAAVGGQQYLSPRTATDRVSVNGGTSALPALAHTGDENTGVAFPANDEVELVTGGIDRVRVTAAGTVINEDGNDHDFRVEGAADEDLLLVDAGTDVVGIGETAANIATEHTANGSLKLLVNGDTLNTGTIRPAAIRSIQDKMATTVAAANAGERPIVYFGQRHSVSGSNSTTFYINTGTLPAGAYVFEGICYTGSAGRYTRHFQYNLGVRSSGSTVNAWFTEIFNEQNAVSSIAVAHTATTGILKIDMTLVDIYSHITCYRSI